MLSMTAFSSVTEQTKFGIMNCEIKAINHRYLELNFKLSDYLREFEANLRHLVREKLARGKVDIYLGIKVDRSVIAATINQDAARNVLKSCDELQSYTQQPTVINMMDVLAEPGVLEKPALPKEELGVYCEKLIASALDTLITNRAIEGQELQKAMLLRCEKIKSILPKLEALQHENKQLQYTRLRKKLADFDMTVDDSRFEQEVVIGIQKADIAEELDRLHAHVKELERLLHLEGPVGRSLDFLMQEFNREANTIASKSVQIESTQLALEIKVLVEQLREQVQNIE